jgi:hypothetical protein
MDNEIYIKVEKFVVEMFGKANDDLGIKHSLRTAYWLKELKNDADESFLTAAVAHDIERAFRDAKEYNHIKNDKDGYKSESHLLHHQNEGANIISKYLEKIGAESEFIGRVVMLVSNHEIGGNDDQNLLKDADSISFFENNVEHFLTKHVEEKGVEKVKEKFQWMFERIDSEKARQIVEPWYKEAMDKISNIK